MQGTDFWSLMGGLALFLCGIHLMGEGLEQAAGSRIKKILQKLTSNRFIGLFTGTAVTALIQSSSAVSVMVIGFVDAGLLSVLHATWLIMGANIGTTVTSQLLALDIGAAAPAAALIGILALSFSKNDPIKKAGKLLAGLGILFLGMKIMESAMRPLQGSPIFLGMMTNFSNPALGILTGALFTAVIQSSSASVGILQALAASGLIPLNSAVYVLFGQNIGTCVTALLASLGAGRNAKQVTLIHFLFNAIGTVIFVGLCAFFPIPGWIAGLTPGRPAAQIANIHTIFNLTTAFFLLPFGSSLVTLAERLLPGRRRLVLYSK